MPHRGVLLSRSVAFAFDRMEMEELRTAHVLDLAEHMHKVLDIVPVEWSEVTDVQTLENVLLVGQRTLQGIIQPDNALAAVIIEITFSVKPLRSPEAQLVVGRVDIKIDEILFHASHGTVY